MIKIKRIKRRRPKRLLRLPRVNITFNQVGIELDQMDTVRKTEIPIKKATKRVTTIIRMAFFFIKCQQGYFFLYGQ